jgi:hypothetical protein
MPEANHSPTPPSAIELSETDLENISGGVVEVSFSLLMVDESSEFLSQQISDGINTSITTSSRKRRSIFGLEFSGTFASMDHAMSFFTGFLNMFSLFRRR